MAFYERLWTQKALQQSQGDSPPIVAAPEITHVNKWDLPFWFKENKYYNVTTYNFQIGQFQSLVTLLWYNQFGLITSNINVFPMFLIINELSLCFNFTDVCRMGKEESRCNCLNHQIGILIRGISKVRDLRKVPV